MNILFIILALACASLPGLAVCTLLKIKENRTLHSIALSYCIFFTAFSLLAYLGLLEKALIAATVCILAASMLLLMTFYFAKRLIFNNLHYVVYLLGIFITTLFYYSLFGATSDLPADLYTHLERYQRSLADLGDEHIDLTFQSLNWLKQGYGWYYFLAALSILANASSIEVLESTGVITNSLFFISLFSFSRTVFQQSKAATITVSYTHLTLPTILRV